MIYRCRRFRAYELVGPSLYNRFGEDSFRYLRTDLLQALDALWEALNAVKKTSIIVNNWKTGGHFQASGVRVPSDKEYREGSAHSYGAAADLKFSTWTPKDALEYMEAKKATDKASPLHNFRRVEDVAITKTWLHLDVLEHDGPGLLVVRP